MDKRKYETKTLIAEYRYLSELEEFRFSETAYRLKDGSIIIEYDGARLSLYGLKLSFQKSIARKGIYSVYDKDYEFWKSVRSKRDDSYFMDWEAEMDEQFKKSQEEYYKQIAAEHENLLKCVGSDELPF